MRILYVACKTFSFHWSHSHWECNRQIQSVWNHSCIAGPNSYGWTWLLWLFLTGVVSSSCIRLESDPAFHELVPMRMGPMKWDCLMYTFSIAALFSLSAFHWIQSDTFYAFNEKEITYSWVVVDSYQTSVAKIFNITANQGCWDNSAMYCHHPDWNVCIYTA